MPESRARIAIESRSMLTSNSQSTPLPLPVIGEKAKDRVITNAETGAPYPLSNLWSEGPGILVFLRHLGCAFCREHISQLQQDFDRFEALGATLGLITVAQPEDTLAFSRDRNLLDHYVCLSDPEKQAYLAYGLSRTSVTGLLTANVFARGFQATLHGHLSGLPKGDPFQMPGLFIVDQEGFIQYAHRSKDASDNPSNASLFEVLERIRR